MLTPISFSLNQISLSDFTYSVWACSDYASVRESIEECGLLQPPIVKKTGDGAYAIVSGQKRIRALRDLGHEQAICLELESRDEPEKIFIHTLWENLSFREYNLIEKGLIINRLDKFTSCGYDIEKLFSRLGLNRDNIFKIKELYFESNSVQQAIACGKVAVYVAFGLPEMEQEDKTSLLRLILDLQIGQNRQREILDSLVDLSKMTGEKIVRLLSDPRLTGLLANSKLNNPQKEDALRRILREKRFPAVVLAEKAFESAKKAIPSPKTIRMENRSPFENDSLQFQVRAETPEDLKNASDYFLALAKRKDIEGLIDLSTGKKGE